MWNDNPMLAVGLAFILGWLADWLVEIVYWRSQRQQRERARYQAQLDAKDVRIKELQKQIEEMRRNAFPAAITSPVGSPTEVDTLRAELRQANARLTKQAQEIAALRRQLDVLRAATPAESTPADEGGTFEIDSMAEEDRALRDLWASVASSDVDAPPDVEEEAREAAAWLSDEPEADSMAPPGEGKPMADQQENRPAPHADDEEI